MKLAADLHTHTLASGHAYSTAMENIRAAAEIGLEMIALTDHGPAMPGGPHAYHFGNQRVIPGQLLGVRILKGIEANVLDQNGKLDLEEGRLAKLDIVLAGLHTHCAPYGTAAENTRMMINTMRNKWVDVIVHPGNPEYPVDMEAIVKASIEYDVALEINNSSLTVSRCGSRPNCDNMAALVKEYGAKVMIGTDSHFYLSVGEFSQALELLSAHGIDEEQVVNTSVEKVLGHLNRRVNRHNCVR
jgi:putative hydrolase